MPDAKVTRYPSREDTEKMLRDGKSDQEALEVLRKWKREHWAQAVKGDKSRLSAIWQLHYAMCEEFHGNRNALSMSTQGGFDCYYPSSRSISLSKPSIITYLHEFAHSLGKGEWEAVEWSLTLFRDAFPVAIRKLKLKGHVMTKT